MDYFTDSGRRMISNFISSLMTSFISSVQAIFIVPLQRHIPVTTSHTKSINTAFVFALRAIVSKTYKG